VEVTVVIASYGNEQWKQLAQRRAGVSAVASSAPHVIWEHGSSLHEARNAGLARVDTEWVCFLDADDELEPGYFEAMEQGTADLRAPAVRYVPWGFSITARGRPAAMPKVAGHQHVCDASCLAEGNWLVVGTVARTEQVSAAGGFADWPVYEDYHLWAKMWLSGATVEAVPQAVYRAHVRQASRNRGSMSAREKHRIHQEIARDLGLKVPA
jgi:glycosyltransferase involved in cell wall biosynthesis